MFLKDTVVAKLNDLGYEDLHGELYRYMLWKNPTYNRLLPDNRTTNDPGMYNLLMQSHTGLPAEETAMHELTACTFILDPAQDLLVWLGSTILLLDKAGVPATFRFVFVSQKLQESSHDLAKTTLQFLGEVRNAMRDPNQPPTLEGFIAQLRNNYRSMFMAWVRPVFSTNARMSSSGSLSLERKEEIRVEKLMALKKAQSDDNNVRVAVQSDKCAYCGNGGHFWIHCNTLTKHRAANTIKHGWIDRN